MNEISKLDSTILNLDEIPLFNFLFYCDIVNTKIK